MGTSLRLVLLTYRFYLVKRSTTINSNSNSKENHTKKCSKDQCVCVCVGDHLAETVTHLVRTSSSSLFKKNGDQSSGSKKDDEFKERKRMKVDLVLFFKLQLD